MKAARLHKYGQPLVIKEVRMPLTLGHENALAPIDTAPLERINDVYARLQRGEVQGRTVIQPAA